MSDNTTSRKIKDALEAMKQEKSTGRAMRFNPRTKKLEVVSESAIDPDDVLRIRPEDAQVFLGH